MEKNLRLYKIPDVGDILSVLAFVTNFNFPQNAEENDIVVNYDSTYGYRLFKYEVVYDELEWIDVQQDTTKYYCAKNDGEPLFFYTNDGVFQPYDVSFPTNADRRSEITSFTYSATRMGNAPTISGTLMYRQCLDELWDDRVCVFFNKKFYFIDKIPTSEFSGGAAGINANVDERYKHQCEFVSENRLLENVYFTNVVDIDSYQGDITKLPMQWLEFSFFGGITEFVSRLNLSLAYSGLDAQHVGFRVVVDSIGTVEEKLITISDTTLKAALDLIYETWGIPYWFDGYTIHIGYSNEQQMAQAGVTMPTFQYGAVQSLLSLQKSQSNDIVNRITGVGSEENIPYFYPNKNPDALEIQYDNGGTLMLNYARIANPYRLVGMRPSTDYVDLHPNGSYFKYMPIQKKYTYDQHVSINTHATKVIEHDSLGTPSLVTLPVEDYNIQSRFFDCYAGSWYYTNDNYDYDVYVCKRVFVWLKEGTLVNLSLKDIMNPKEMFSGTNAYLSDSSLFGFILSHNPRVYVKAQSYVKTRAQYEDLVQNSSGFNASASADIFDDYFDFYVPSGSNTVKYKWSDNTVTDTYDEIFPVEINSLPQNSTCVCFTVAFLLTRKTQLGQLFIDTVKTNLKNSTQTVLKHTFLDANPDWSLNASGKATPLYKYGIRLNSGVTPQNGDFIYFTREAGALPTFSRLLPYSFRTTKDIWLNAINNPAYPKEDGQGNYVFENLYKISCAKEHVENFDDIKPTIKGMMNNESPAKHIDQILDVAFDQDDNNDLDASGEGYQHDYFFVKLAKTSLDDGFSFNLFDCAIEGQTMKINMADGNCGGCTFEVMVKYRSDGTAINPVGLFDAATTINGVTYAAGTPKRDLTTGRVLTNLNESDQQDTSAQSVWIALKKDAETFGNYDNGNAVILPDSARGQNFIPANGDSFTIINICLPYAYIVAAEQRLYYALLDYMEANNPRTWSFNIKFSSIYYKKHYEFMEKWLNESSRVPFVYNGITRTYYVQSYNYKVTNTSALPEVTVELQEKVKKLNVYYPVPYNPYANVAVTETANQKKLRKIISDYIGAMPSQNIEVGDIQVNGDIRLSDGTSLNGQITAINSHIFSNDKILTPENTWSKVKTAAEVENLFFDGLFATEENKVDVSDATCRFIEDSSEKWTNLSISFSSASGHVVLQQNIEVEEGSHYTVSFIAKSSSDTEIYAYLKYFDERDNDITQEEHNTVSIVSDFNKYILLETAPYDASYAKICFENATENTGISIFVGKVMVLDKDLTTKDQNGSLVPSSMFPTNFKNSIKDFLYQSGGGSPLQEVLYCEFTYSSGYVGTMDKTASEIVSAFQGGKVVVAHINTNKRVYYCIEANTSNNSTVIKFLWCGTTSDNTNLSGMQFSELRYVNSEWRIVENNFNSQIKLIGSGSGQNIKTINNESLLGSGDLSIQTPLYDNGTRVLIDSDGSHTVDLTDHSVTIINFEDGVTSVNLTLNIDAVGDREVILKRAVGGASVTVNINGFSTILSTNLLRLYTGSVTLNSDNPRYFTVKVRKINSNLYFIEGSTFLTPNSYGGSWWIQ